jgi:hypothetical protein
MSLSKKPNNFFKNMLYANTMCCRVREEISLRAVSDPMESENLSRSLSDRIFFTRIGVHFA